jgi:site-specific recombinase XerD
MDALLLEALYKQFNGYLIWLRNQSLSSHTRRAYKSRAEQYLVFLATSGGDYGEVLTSSETRARALSDYVQYMREEIGSKPNSINNALTGIDSFHQFLGLEVAEVEREPVPEEGPGALNKVEQQLFINVLERNKSAKKRALALLMLYAGLRVGECAALDVRDFAVRKGVITIRSRRDHRRRQVLVDETVAQALREWLAQRRKRFPEATDNALFLNPQGRRMSSTGIYLIVQELGKLAGLDVSPYVLRHTCLQNLIEYGRELNQVSQLAGHKRLRTTRRYRRGQIAGVAHGVDLQSGEQLSEMS